MGGYAEKIKERDQIIAKQRGEMGRAADALRDSSEQRKDHVHRPPRLAADVTAHVLPHTTVELADD